MSLPAFENAIESFRRFAASSKAPDNIRFIDRDDIIITGRFASIRTGPTKERFEKARQRYETAMAAGFGVQILAVAASQSELFALVYQPSSREDAVERQIPCDVKFAILQPLFVAKQAGGIIWWLLQRRARSDAWLEEWKRDTFGPAA